MEPQQIPTEDVIVLDELPKMEEMFRGEFGLIWRRELRALLASCMDPETPVDAARTCEFTFGFTPDATLSSAVVSLAIKRTLPSGLPPESSRIVFEEREGKLAAALRQTLSDEELQSVAHRPIEVEPAALEEWDLHGSWAVSLARVLLNIQDGRAQTDKVRSVKVKVVLIPDADRMAVETEVRFSEKISAPRPRSSGPLYIQGDKQGKLRADFDVIADAPGDAVGETVRVRQSRIDETLN